MKTGPTYVAGVCCLLLENHDSRLLSLETPPAIVEGMYSSMVEVAVAPSIGIVHSPAFTSMPADAAADASVARYLAASDSTAALMDICWKLCTVLIVVVLAAWAFGVLPVAIRFF